MGVKDESASTEDADGMASDLGVHRGQLGVGRRVSRHLRQMLQGEHNTSDSFQETDGTVPQSSFCKTLVLGPQEWWRPLDAVLRNSEDTLLF